MSCHAFIGRLLQPSICEEHFISIDKFFSSSFPQVNLLTQQGCPSHTHLLS
jgi:hypothetical protein